MKHIQDDMKLARDMGQQLTDILCLYSCGYSQGCRSSSTDRPHHTCSLCLRMLLCATWLPVGTGTWSSRVIHRSGLPTVCLPKLFWLLHPDKTNKT